MAIPYPPRKFLTDDDNKDDKDHKVHTVYPIVCVCVCVLSLRPIVCILL